MPQQRWFGWIAAAALTLAACDSASEEEGGAAAELQVNAAAEGAVEGKAEIKGDADARAAGADANIGVIPAGKLDLKAIGFLVEKGMVKDAKQLEKTLNDRKKNFHELDVDGDGKLDKLVVVEIREEATSKFEIRVIPSSAKGKEKAEAAMTVAVITFTPNEETSKVEVTLAYTEVVTHDHDDEIHFEVVVVLQNTKVVVEDNTFVGWVYKSRPVYVSVVIAPHVDIVIEEEGCWPPGHCKHHDWGHDASFSIYFSTGYHHHGHRKHKKYKKHRKYKHHRHRGHRGHKRGKRGRW